jgi:hypothetical protein
VMSFMCCVLRARRGKCRRRKRKSKKRDRQIVSQIS